MRAQRISVVLCFLALLAVLGRGAQVVFEQAASQARSQMTLVAAQETLGEPTHPVITVHLDASGAPLEVSTNTGAPPQAGDGVIATEAGRRITVSNALAAMIHEHRYVGDWSVPGAWHAWVGAD